MLRVAAGLKSFLPFAQGPASGFWGGAGIEVDEFVCLQGGAQEFAQVADGIFAEVELVFGSQLEQNCGVQGQVGLRFGMGFEGLAQQAADEANTGRDWFSVCFGGWQQYQGGCVTAFFKVQRLRLPAAGRCGQQ